jgi:hypothetical protein
VSPIAGENFHYRIKASPAGPLASVFDPPTHFAGACGWRRSPASVGGRTGQKSPRAAHIGKTDDYELVPDQYLAVDFGEHRFAIPLDNSRPGPEAANLIGIDEGGNTDLTKFWVW